VHLHDDSAAFTCQRLHPIAHQHHNEQQRQFYKQQCQMHLEMSAQMAAPRTNDCNNVPTEANSDRKKRQTLPCRTTLILLSWLSENLDKPYPNSREKQDLLLKTRITTQHLDYWFINARCRKIGIFRRLKENDQNIALYFSMFGT
jgi:hypothetical protein